MPGEQVRIVKGHTFKLKSFANMTWCDYSRKLLFGIDKQGLQCTRRDALLPDPLTRPKFAVGDWACSPRHHMRLHCFRCLPR